MNTLEKDLVELIEFMWPSLHEVVIEAAAGDEKIANEFLMLANDETITNKKKDYPDLFRKSENGLVAAMKGSQFMAEMNLSFGVHIGDTEDFGLARGISLYLMEHFCAESGLDRYRFIEMLDQERKSRGLGNDPFNAKSLKPYCQSTLDRLDVAKNDAIPAALMAGAL